MKGTPPRAATFVAKRVLPKSSFKGSPESRGQAPNADPVLVFKDEDLAPLPSNGVADNLLKGGDKPGSTEGRVLTLTLPYPVDQEPEDTDTVCLEIEGVELVEQVNFHGTDPVELDLPVAVRENPGTYKINYVITFPDNDGKGPLGQTFTVDYQAPGADLAVIDFPFEPIEGLTPERLDSEGNLPAHVYGYVGLDIDDRIILIIDNVENPAAEIVDHIPAPGDPIQVSYPAAMIEALTDGAHTFAYRVTDRAGNKSGNSEGVELVSLIDGFIDDLVKPGVEQSAVPLVDDAVSRSGGGVTVTIPANAKLAPTYKAVIYWGAAASAPITLPADVATAGASYVVPYGTVYDAWFATSSGDDKAVAVAVRYEVSLNGLTAGDAPATDVNMNLYLAGGDDPDPETPEHDALIAPTVKSASGAVNQIPIADFEKPGTMLIPYLTVAPPDPGEAVPAFILGDIITVQYGAAPIFTHPVSQDDLDAAEAAAPDAKFIEFELTAATIEAGDTGAVPVTYTITRKIAGGDGTGANISLSPIQTVAASSSEDLPGGGQPLAAATWPEGATAPNGAIGANEAAKGVNIVIPWYINKQLGDEIVVSLLLGPTKTHAADEVAIEPPRVGERIHTVGGSDSGQDQPSTVTFGTKELMYFHTPPLRMHAHFTYTVKPPGGVHGAPSTVFYVEVDSRGDPVTS